MDYYNEDIEDDAKANKWSDTDSNQYRLINVLENAREENGQANDVDYDGYPPTSVPQIGAVSPMLAQGLVLNMTSMEKRFQNLGRIMIPNLAH